MKWTRERQAVVAEMGVFNINSTTRASAPGTPTTNRRTQRSILFIGVLVGLRVRRGKSSSEAHGACCLRETSGMAVTSPTLSGPERLPAGLLTAT